MCAWKFAYKSHSANITNLFEMERVENEKLTYTRTHSEEFHKIVICLKISKYLKRHLRISALHVNMYIMCALYSAWHCNFNIPTETTTAYKMHWTKNATQIPFVCCTVCFFHVFCTHNDWNPPFKWWWWWRWWWFKSVQSSAILI